MLKWQLIKHPLAEEHLGNAVLTEYLQRTPISADYSKCSKQLMQDKDSYKLLYDKEAIGIITVKQSESATHFLLVAVFTPIEYLN